MLEPAKQELGGKSIPTAVPHPLDLIKRKEPAAEPQAQGSERFTRPRALSPEDEQKITTNWSILLTLMNHSCLLNRKLAKLMYER